jgi:hypothetical protein
MDAALTLLYLVAAGVNYGWQPTEHAKGGSEYIVQVEPELLDVLHSGESAPIESNVPPEVAPIRKVKIVVGRAELPRENASAISRTAYFAGQAGWTPDRYGPIEPAGATSGQRYPPPSLSSSSQVGPPPSIVDRAQAAVTETGSTLRDGVEAGIRAANDQLSRGGEELLDATRDAGQEFGQQLRDLTYPSSRELQTTGNNLRDATERTIGAAGNRLQQVSNPFVTATEAPTTAPATRVGVAPPPWTDSSANSAASSPGRSTVANGASPGQTAAQAGGSTASSAGWTSIGTTVAAPPLIIPPMSTTVRTGNARPFQTSPAAVEGPQFPDTPSTRREAIHSPLTDPAQQASTKTSKDEWSTGWGTGPSTPQVSINRAGNTPSITDSEHNPDLVRVQPADTPQRNGEQSTSRFEDLWDNASIWAQSAQAPPTSATQSNGVSNLPTNAAAQISSNNTSNSQPATNSTPLAEVVTAGHPSPSVQRADEPPWLPLLLVSLSLMGSLSANLFLGWSYMDARQKYRSLVRKTADRFRRAAA